MRLLMHSLGVWALLVPLAVLNGGLRELVLAPVLGWWAQPLSGVLLCAMVLAATLLLLPRMGVASPRVYVGMGALWMFMTVLFETGLGLVSGEPLGELLNAYNPSTGNLWLLVVLFIGCAPRLAARLRMSV